MTVIFQSHHQFEFCDKILRSFAEDDGDSLLVATSSQEVSLASLKMLQIFSPLLMEIVETLPLTSTPHTLIIPDADAESWKHLTGLLTNGNVDINLPSDNSNIKCQKDKISSLAQCLRIKLETKQVSEEARIKLRVKRPEELMDGSNFPPISNQETNIVNNDYDSDKEEDRVPIKSEKLHSSNCAFSEYTFPVNCEINETEKSFVSEGERCSDSGIDIEPSLGIQEVTNSQVKGLNLTPPTEKILLDNEESIGKPEFKDGNKNQIETPSLISEQTSVKLKSPEELVSCDEARSQSFSDDSRSRSIGESDREQVVAKGHREGVYSNMPWSYMSFLRWQNKDESLSSHANSQDKFGFWYNKDPSVGQDDNAEICSFNMQEKVRVSQSSDTRYHTDKKRLELEKELEREEMEQKSIRKKRRQEEGTNNDSDSQARRILRCRHIGCKDLEFHSREELKSHISKVHMTPACSRCKRVFKSEDSFFEHMNASHLKIRRPYVCSECPGDGRLGPAVYVSRKQLTDHLDRIHSKRISRSGYSFENSSASFLYETEACYKR